MEHENDNLSDPVLVAQVLAGDRTALEPLLRRYYPSLVQLCMRLLDSPFEAQDVAQEAVLQAVLGLARLCEPARFGAWLHAIAANLACKDASSECYKN
jgi:RNA polymerase sigma-70 factor (ECF subfamily)